MPEETPPPDAAAPPVVPPPTEPIPDHPGVTAAEPEDRFRTWVAMAIAAISILGAVVAFNGTLAGQDARRLDQQGIQDAARRQQVVTDLQATVDQDLRFLAGYQEHVKAANLLDADAATLDATDAASASLLRAQAQSERVLARSLQRFFRGAMPAAGAADGPVQYDAKAALQRLENANGDLQQLRPEATFAQADSRHTQSVQLVGLVTLFIAALLFLTLAQFTRPAIRRIFAGAGGAVAVLAVILWAVVLRTGA